MGKNDIQAKQFQPNENLLPNSQILRAGMLEHNLTT